MSKSGDQKLKLLYLIKILYERTDEEHRITTQELITELNKFGIQAERKSIYNDIEGLRQFGYDVAMCKTRQNGGYYLASREFELPELKLLVDAVQASRFITIKKSNELIKKLESLSSRYEAKQLQRQVYVTDRVKTENENIYYNVDDIHKAIQDHVKVSFQYFEWNVDKTMTFRKNGERYKVSPVALIWRDENYYLVAYEESDQMIKHYRVDKMLHIELLEEPSEGTESLKNFRIAEYANRTFGMYAGREEIVTIYFANRLIGVVLDRFGKEIDIRKRENDMFSARVKVAVSGQFFGWITGLGKEARIDSPEMVAREYRHYLNELLELYQK